MSKSPTDKPQHYTILVIPANGTRVKKLFLPDSVVRALPYFSVGLGVALVLLTVLVVYYGFAAFTNRNARRELVQWRTTMDQVYAHVKTLEQNLDRMAAFDTKLRVISDLRDPDRQLAMGPLPIDQPKSDSPFDDVMPTLHLESGPSHPTELLMNVKRLQQQSQKRERSLAELTDRLYDQELILAATPAVWPVSGHLTSRFGMRISPFTGQDKFHAGIDVGAPPGTRVYAPGDGSVAFVGSKTGYGFTLIVNHGYGIATCYAHLSGVLVKNGEKVRRGQSIALVGNTGMSTGPHLHYEVRLHGVTQDPTLFILN